MVVLVGPRSFDSAVERRFDLVRDKSVLSASTRCLHTQSGAFAVETSYVSLSEHIRFSFFIFYRGQRVDVIGAISFLISQAAGLGLAKTMPTSVTGMCARSFSVAQLRHQPFSRPFSL